MEKVFLLAFLLLAGLALLVWLSMIQYRIIRRLLIEDIRQRIKEEKDR